MGASVCASCLAVGLAGDYAIVNGPWKELLTVTFVGNSELLTTLSTTCGEHAAAISCQHTFTETVLILSLAVVGLECSFHCYIYL